jgi:hypothetical protein
MANKVAQSVNGQAPGETYAGDAALLPFYLVHGYVYDDTSTTSKLNNTGVASTSDDPTLAINREEPWDTVVKMGSNESAYAARIHSIESVNDDVYENALPVAGGTVMRVYGDNFTGATSVTFGGTAGTAFSVVDDNTIQVTSPAKTAGSYDVVVVKAAGNATLVSGVSYV